MQKLESAFRMDFVRTYPGLKIERIENKVSSGLPDLWWASLDRRSGWIELKATQKCSSVDLAHFKPNQMASMNALDRYTNTALLCRIGDILTIHKPPFRTRHNRKHSELHGLTPDEFIGLAYWSARRWPALNELLDILSPAREVRVFYSTPLSPAPKTDTCSNTVTGVSLSPAPKTDTCSNTVTGVSLSPAPKTDTCSNTAMGGSNIATGVFEPSAPGTNTCSNIARVIFQSAEPGAEGL